MNRATADHYTWNGNPNEGPSLACDGWHLVRTATLSVIEERMPPTAAEQRHRHAQARQFFYVIEGELTMECDGGTHTLSANQGLEIAPGQPHQAMNRSTADVRFLLTSQPPSHGDRLASPF